MNAYSAEAIMILREDLMFDCEQPVSFVKGDYGVQYIVIYTKGEWTADFLSTHFCKKS